MSQGLRHVTSSIVPEILKVWKCQRGFTVGSAGRDREKRNHSKHWLFKKDFLFGFNSDRLFPLWTYVNWPHLLAPSKSFFLASCLLGSMRERVQGVGVRWGDGGGQGIWAWWEAQALKGHFHLTLVGLGWILSFVSPCKWKSIPRLCCSVHFLSSYLVNVDCI